jgi:hypothetical protein
MLQWLRRAWQHPDLFREMRSSMGSDVKTPAKVDGAVEAYLMLLWFVVGKWFVDVKQRMRAWSRWCFFIFLASCESDPSSWRGFPNFPNDLRSAESESRQRTHHIDLLNDRLDLCPCAQKCITRHAPCSLSRWANCTVCA